MMHQHLQPSAAARAGPFQHRAITIRIAKRSVRTLADEAVDPDYLSDAIVDESYLRQAHQYRLAVFHFILRLVERSHNLLWWNAIHALRIDTHKRLPTASDDVGSESVGTQILHDLEHRLIDQVGVRSLEPRILFCHQPSRNNLLKRVGAHP